MTLADISSSTVRERSSVSGPSSLQVVFFCVPSLDLHQMTFALGEAVAHLHALWFAGKLKRVKGEDGVFRFSAV